MSEYAKHLLPSGATGLEKGLATVDTERLALLPPQALLRLLDPLTCPAVFLPALAFELSVEEEWDLAVTEAQQRALLANAYALNAKKGTPFAIKRGLAVVGFPGATLVEGKPEVRHDRVILKRNGRFRYNSSARWALFDVHVPLAAGQAFEAAERARVLRGIEIWQRAACYLDTLRAVVAPEVVRDTPAMVDPVVRVGLVLHPHRDTPRDGRHRRGGARRYAYDGRDRHDGQVPRDGSGATTGTLRFGAERVDATVAVRVRISARRGTALHFDKAVLRDGSIRRGFVGALMRPNIAPILVPLPTDRITRGPTILRDAAIVYDGALPRGYDGALMRLGSEPVIVQHPSRTIRRPPSLRYDAAAFRDGTLTRGSNGALMRLAQRGQFSPGFDEGFA